MIIKHKHHLFLSSFCLSWFLIFSSQLIVQAKEVSNKSGNFASITFEPPEEHQQPQATEAGASRGSQCLIDSTETQKPFTALIPSNNYGLTLASYPTLLVYVPTVSAKYLFLTLQEENQEEIYQEILPIKNQSGIISIDIPANAPGLEIEKSYKWSLALMCDNKLRPDSPITEGFIRRIQPKSDLAIQLQDADLIDMTALYGKAGIWYETIATLAQLRLAEPDNQELLTAWNHILNNVGLENMVNLKIVD